MSSRLQICGCAIRLFVTSATEDAQHPTCVTTVHTTEDARHPTHVTTVHTTEDARHPTHVTTVHTKEDARHPTHVTTVRRLHLEPAVCTQGLGAGGAHGHSPQI